MINWAKHDYYKKKILKFLKREESLIMKIHALRNNDDKKAKAKLLKLGDELINLHRYERVKFLKCIAKNKRK